MDTNKNLIRPYVYCPTKAIPCRSLIDPILSNRKLPEWPQFRDRTVIPFYLGRVALWYLCDIWNVQPGDEVLMPAYNCGTEVDPFHARGLAVKFYRVDETGRMDSDDAKNRCSARTRILYITHCLNQHQAVGAIYDWCKARRIRVVEDCALALFSKGPEGHLGTLADAAIFSFKKFLPVPDGGVLSVRESVRNSTVSLRRPPFGRLVRSLLPFAKSTALSTLDACHFYDPWVTVMHRIRRKSIAIGKSYEPEYPGMPQSYYFDMHYQNCTFSRIAAGVLRRTDPEVVVSRRRNNYAALVAFLDSIDGINIPRRVLDNGICPVGLFITAPHRNRIVAMLNAQGIDATSWWSGYHRSFDWSDFTEARYLKNNMLYLPIDQSLGIDHIEYIAKCVKRAAGVVVSREIGKTPALTAASAGSLQARNGACYGKVWKV